jgi:hypothetical protein
MKDYRSLGTKYRQMVEDRMNRNSELRKKVHNVARPDDADPTSEKSKLAKQAEIKTKIIDEVALDAGPNQPMSLEDYKVGDMVHAGIGTKGGAGYKGKVHHVDASHVYLHINTGKYGPRIVKAPKHLVTKENEKNIGEENINEIGDTPAGKKAVNAVGTRADHRIMSAIGDGGVLSTRNYNPSDLKKNVKVSMQAAKRLNKEETELDENSVAAIPKDDIQVNANSPDPATTKDKKKKDSNTDEMDPKKLTGGKTEVDLKPTTDDRPEDTTKEDEKGKRAAKSENNKIGAKGVKEETMTTKNFGLSDALIQTVTEVLKGKQHKIDANHNGKIDADDFKLLKGKKKMMEGKCPKCGMDPCQCGHMKEEVEEIEELSKKTMSNYIRKASSDAANQAYTAGMGDEGEKINKDEYHAKAVKRLKGISAASQKLAKEEAESVDESNPINKEKKNAAAIAVGSKNRDAQHVGSRGMRMDVADKIRGREKLSGKDRQHYGEEVETIDELSKETLRSYAQKALRKGDMAARMSNNGTKKDMSDIANKRREGVSKAINKMAEEVEQFDEASKSSMAKPKSYSDTMKKAPTFSSSNIAKMERDEKARQSKQAFGDMFGGGNPANKLSVKKEEVELSADELARIEAIVKGF